MMRRRWCGERRTGSLLRRAGWGKLKKLTAYTWWGDPSQLTSSKNREHFCSRGLARHHLSLLPWIVSNVMCNLRPFLIKLHEMWYAWYPWCALQPRGMYYLCYIYKMLPDHVAMCHGFCWAAHLESALCVCRSLRNKLARVGNHSLLQQNPAQEIAALNIITGVCLFIL